MLMIKVKNRMEGHRRSDMALNHFFQSFPMQWMKTSIIDHDDFSQQTTLSARFHPRTMPGLILVTKMNTTGEEGNIKKTFEDW